MYINVFFNLLVKWNFTHMITYSCFTLYILHATMLHVQFRCNFTLAHEQFTCTLEQFTHTRTELLVACALLPVRNSHRRTHTGLLDDFREWDYTTILWICILETAELDRKWISCGGQNALNLLSRFSWTQMWLI